ncbi:MAG: 5-oxoprolinase subunit PxpB [Vicinamibacterales bacterium]
MLRPRLREAGDAALLAELPARIDPMTNAAVLQLGQRVRAAALKGVRDIVPGIRSLAVFFDPLHADVEALKALLLSKALEPDIVAEGRRHKIPVVYGGDAGPDLLSVAQTSGLSVDALIAGHSGRDYRVYMLGFLPGFAYLGTLDPAIVAARLPVPRVRVPAGSVGVAGRQTGIYPRESPGGWGLIGRTPLAMFDAAGDSPARFAPGDIVRFVPVAGADWPVNAPTDHEAGRHTTPVIEVMHAGMLTSVQDLGRTGRQAVGVSVAGAMDRVAHRVANALVGNESTAATLEVTVAGPELRCLRDTVIAVTGADLSPRIDGRRVTANQPLVVPEGGVVSFGERRTGARAYVAFAGGIDVPLVLGSRATHVASGQGGVAGRAVRAGDRLALFARGPLPRRTPPRPAHEAARGGARVRVLSGPQVDSFAAEALTRLTSARFLVSPASNRMGYRLTGAPVPAPAGEMISDITFPGAIQVPPSGEPILLMADRQTTGGYAQLAIVITADLPVVGQLAPGDWVEFEVTTPAEALAALVDQERMIQHFEGHAFA